MLFALREDISALRQQINDKYGEDDRKSKGLPDVRALMVSNHEPADFGGNPLDQSERRVIEETLARHDGNKKLAAEELQISLRTLYRKMQELGIS